MFGEPIRRFIASTVLFLMLMGLFPAASQGQYEFKRTVEIVLVNLVVRDKSGNVVRGLKPGDFTVLEDGKPQSIASFDFEEVDTAALPTASPSQAVLTMPKAAPSTAPPKPSPQESIDLHGRRLMVLFFDLSSMQPEEIERAVNAASDYVDKQMTAADLVAVVSLSSSLQVNQDFTSDRELLKKAVARLSPSAGQGFEEGGTGDTEGAADTSDAYSPDETEYNIFNTDRRLEAIRSLADALARIQQKKSVIYFSGGMSKTGVENEAQLRAAINEAVRANMALYTMDIRGLQAMVPGGEAQQASLRGTAPYSGASVRTQYASNFDSQETISTLANDTGGRAFLDSNDFNQAFKRVQADTAAYYLIGYHSNNPAHDGRFRRITVKTKIPGVKLEYRAGYYAPRDFAHSSHEDREQQLLDELSTDLPSTDLDVYLSAGYFRLTDNRFYVPVSLVVRGSQIPFTQAGDKDKASLDIIGLVQDELRRPVGNMRDTVKLNLDASQAVRRKNVQYDTGFYLPSGKYHLKFVIRENQNGSMGSFETDFVIPDFKKTPLKMSAVVLGTQMKPSSKKRSDNPLVHDSNELVPNVTHVAPTDGHLYFYYEVYDPARDSRKPEVQEAQHTPAPKSAIRLLTSIQFFHGKVKAYETPLVETRQLTAPDRKAAVFQFDVPLTQLQPGLYTCQVNVVDDAAGTFTFPRFMLLVRGEAKRAQAAQPSL